MPSSFYNILNNVATQVGATHLPGDGEVVVQANVDVFGTDFPIRVTCYNRALAQTVIYDVTGVNLGANALVIGGAIEGTTDIGLLYGDPVEMRITAGTITDIQNALGSGGAQGPQGSTGPQGNQGVAGAQGATGPQGTAGSQGPAGSSGPQGSQGAIGTQGPQGYQGSAFSTTTTGILKGTGTSVVAATAGTDYLAPSGSGASLTNVVNSITGTSNQVIATASTGAVTLSLPQSIASTSTPTFASATLTSGMTVSGGTVTLSGGIVSFSQTVDSTTNGITSALTSSILQSDTSDTGTDLALSSLVTAIQFTASGAINPRSIGLQLKIATTATNNTQYLTVQLYTDNSGAPGSLVSGSTAVTFLYGNLTTSYVEYQFSLGSVSLSASTLYWIVIVQSQAPSSTISLNTGSSNNTNVGTGATVGSVSVAAGASCYYKLYGRTGTGITATSTNGNGVSGTSTNGYGVSGTSTNVYGVYGSSSNGYGLYGISTNNTGIRGVSTNLYGVYGSSTSSYGVYGVSTSNYGVSGISTSGSGCFFQSTTGLGGRIQQSGSLTSSNGSTVYTGHIYRNLTLGSYDAPGEVLRVEDNTTSSGPLQTWVKSSTTVAKIDRYGHLFLSAQTPTIAAGVAAGTSPTVSISGSDQRGVVTITTGTSPTTGVLATVTYGQTMGSNPGGIVFSPVSTNAAAVVASVYTDTTAWSATAWTLNAATALAASTTYKFSYVVVG